MKRIALILSILPCHAEPSADPAAAGERKTLETFATAVEAKQPPKPQVIAAESGGKVFHAPILLASPLCLQCHGNPERDIAPATLEALGKAYPQDQATGYTVGSRKGRVGRPRPTGTVLNGPLHLDGDNQPSRCFADDRGRIVPTFADDRGRIVPTFADDRGRIVPTFSTSSPTNPATPPSG